MQVRHCRSFEYSLVQEIDGRYEIGPRVEPACNFWAVHVIDECPLSAISGHSETCPDPGMSTYAKYDKKIGGWRANKPLWPGICVGFGSGYPAFALSFVQMMRNA